MMENATREKMMRGKTEMMNRTAVKSMRVNGVRMSSTRSSTRRTA